MTTAIPDAFESGFEFEHKPVMDQKLDRCAALEKELKKMKHWEQEVLEVRLAMERNRTTSMHADAYANLYKRNADMHKKFAEVNLESEKEKAKQQQSYTETRAQQREEENAAKYAAWQRQFEELKRGVENQNRKPQTNAEEGMGGARIPKADPPGPRRHSASAHSASGAERASQSAHWERQWKEFEAKQRQREAEEKAKREKTNNPWEQQWEEFEANRKRREEDMKRDDYKWYNTQGTDYSWYQKQAGGGGYSSERSGYGSQYHRPTAGSKEAFTTVETGVDKHDKEWEKFEQWAAGPNATIRMVNIPFLQADMLRQENRYQLFGYGKSSAERKAVLRKLVIRWHPDKFLQKFGKKIDEEMRSTIIDRVTTMSQALNLLDQSY